MYPRTYDYRPLTRSDLGDAYYPPVLLRKEKKKGNRKGALAGQVLSADPVHVHIFFGRGEVGPWYSSIKELRFSLVNTVFCSSVSMVNVRKRLGNFRGTLTFWKRLEHRGQQNETKNKAVKFFCLEVLNERGKNKRTTHLA